MADNANGHTSGSERETWMEFVNFDGRIQGATARKLIQKAKAQGRTPQDVLQDLVRNALGATDSEAKVEPMTINTGNGGFHVLTFVTDGYGYLLTENSAGEELARAKWDTPDDGPTDTEVFKTLAEQSFAKLDAPNTD